jgi:hypothetical protein
MYIERIRRRKRGKRVYYSWQLFCRFETISKFKIINTIIKKLS